MSNYADREENVPRIEPMPGWVLEVLDARRERLRPLADALEKWVEDVAGGGPGDPNYDPRGLQIGLTAVRALRGEEHG